MNEYLIWLANGMWVVVDAISLENAKAIVATKFGPIAENQYAMFTKTKEK